MPSAVHEINNSPLWQSLKHPEVRATVFLPPEEKLRWILGFLRKPHWREDLEGDRLEMFVAFYIMHLGPGIFLWAQEDQEDNLMPVFHSVGPPPPPRSEWPTFVKTLRSAALGFLFEVLGARAKRKNTTPFRSEKDLLAGLPCVELTSGRRYSLIRGGKLFHVYKMEDPISPFLLMLGDLLAEVDCARLSLCQICFYPFYKAKNQHYCSVACTRKAHPSKPRVQQSRERKARWNHARQNLDQVLGDIQLIRQKQKLPRPRSEQQVLKEAEPILKNAEKAFAAAYPREQGRGYEEGKRLLVQGKEQIDRLRKRVKGY
jgi:hypothetical protein